MDYLYGERVVSSFMINDFRKTLETLGHIESFCKAKDGVVEAWAKHFRGVFNSIQTKYKTPYVITQRKPGELKTLWKEKIY